MKNIKDIQIGDIVVDQEGFKAKVLEKLQNSVMLSDFDDCGDYRSVGDWLTFEELEQKDWFIEKKEKEEWKPENGERYYYVNQNGIIANNVQHRFYEDYDRYEFGNCFKTQEQAVEAIGLVKKTLQEYRRKI